MLLRQSPQLELRKINLKLPSEVWSRYDQMVINARERGLSTALEEALAQSLTRMLARAERELKIVMSKTPHQKMPDAN